MAKGTLIELSLAKNKHQKDSGKAVQKTINCVMEKTMHQGELLQDTKYNNFSLRQVIFHH